jgi:AcrR family transcriptional regulator
MADSPRTSGRFPAESRKQQIVETVLDLVAVHGTEALSFQLVADRIGVTQPAVLRHFPTKEALWLALMDWLEQRLIGIYSSAGEVDEAGEAALVVLSRMFLEHIRLIERYPALAKLVFSDHLRLQFPSLQARFGNIHKAYTARLSAVLDRAKSDGSVSATVSPGDGAAMFLSLVQGLGFQAAIAGLLGRLQPEAERLFALYLQGLMCGQAAAGRARRAIKAAKRKLERSGIGVRRKQRTPLASW